MFMKCCSISAACLLAASVVLAQARRAAAPPADSSTPPAAAANQPADAQPIPTSAAGGGAKWRTPSGVIRTSGDSQAPADATAPLRTLSGGPTRQSIARVAKGPDTLPSDAGQEWRDYDISPYTTRVTSTNRPEQAILDWILRETGYEAWHTQPLAFLSIDNRRLRVFHTPEMHVTVSEMVDRFVNTEAESHAFGMRVLTVGSPNWRAKAHKMLHPITTQTQGVQAWLLAKEDAALLAADLRRRSDFQEHSTPHLLVNNGQSTQVPAMRPRNYVRDVLLKSDAWGGFEPQMAQYEEGFKLEFNPLLSLDGKVVDAVIRCEVNQVEKMIPIMIDVSTAAVRGQRTKIEVPQGISSRLHERFRWPADQVLLISLGVGPAPVVQTANPLNALVSSPTRAELLVLVESKGKVGSQATVAPPGQRNASAYRNRY
jgi:hypothetical protein